MSDEHYEDQDGDDGELEGSFEEQILALIKNQSQLIQGLIDSQSNQASINEHTLEIINGLEARIEMLEQNR